MSFLLVTFTLEDEGRHLSENKCFPGVARRMDWRPSHKERKPVFPSTPRRSAFPSQHIQAFNGAAGASRMRKVSILASQGLFEAQSLRSKPYAWGLFTCGGKIPAPVCSVTCSSASQTSVTCSRRLC